MVNNNQFVHLEQLSRLTNSCIFVCGIRHGAYYFISSNFNDIIGLEVPQGGWSPDPMFLEQHIHPADRLLFERTADHLYFDYIDSLPPEQQRDYKHVFEFRAVKPGGEIVRVINQHQIIELDTPDRAVVMGTIDLSPDQNPDLGFRCTLINFRTGEIVPFSVGAAEEGLLTPREREILELVGKGMYSKEISERLCISIHTVNRHRQNILEKMDVGNTSEALFLARKLGLLS